MQTAVIAKPQTKIFATFFIINMFCSYKVSHGMTKPDKKIEIITIFIEILGEDE
jgi:hypothetical protein